MPVSRWNLGLPPLTGPAIGSRPRLKKRRADLIVKRRELRRSLRLDHFTTTMVLGFRGADPEIDIQWSTDIFAKHPPETAVINSSNQLASQIPPRQRVIS